jgi:hypothetical protein
MVDSFFLIVMLPVIIVFFFILPLFEKKPEVDPVLPSELDDWDAEFTQLTGKTIWQARCEANPELLKSQVDLSSTQNNPNPFY